MKWFDSRRKLHNVRLTAKHHIQYMGWWVVLAICLVLAIDVLLFAVYRGYLLESEGWSTVSTWQQLSAHSTFLIPLGMTTLILITAILSLAMFTAHRIAGPFLAVIRTCKAIQAGQLNCQLHFREYDNLEEVATAFNEMMSALRARREEKQETAQRLKVVGE